MSAPEPARPRSSGGGVRGPDPLPDLDQTPAFGTTDPEPSPGFDFDPTAIQRTFEPGRRESTRGRAWRVPAEPVRMALRCASLTLTLIAPSAAIRPAGPPLHKRMSLHVFLAELRRRRVFRVVLIYLVVAPAMVARRWTCPAGL